MTDFIILAILAGAVIGGVLAGKKHFKGEGGCCGGSTYKARKKKLDRVSATKIFEVEGMSCQHCVNRVMEAVNSISGASAAVNLKKGLVTVSMEHEIAQDVIKNAIENAGYKVKGIR